MTIGQFEFADDYSGRIKYVGNTLQYVIIKPIPVTSGLFSRMLRWMYQDMEVVVALIKDDGREWHAPGYYAQLGDLREHKLNS